MSADLLADLDSFYHAPTKSDVGPQDREDSAKIRASVKQSSDNVNKDSLSYLTFQNQNPWKDTFTSSVKSQSEAKDLVSNNDTEWGEFELGEAPSKTSSNILESREGIRYSFSNDRAAKSSSNEVNLGEKSLHFNREASTPENLEIDQIRLNGSEKLSKPIQQRSGQRQDSNVLFDIETEYDEDDFGDFEVPTVSSTIGSHENYQQSDVASGATLIDFDVEPASKVTESSTGGLNYQMSKNFDPFEAIGLSDEPHKSSNESHQFVESQKAPHKGEKSIVGLQSSDSNVQAHIGPRNILDSESAIAQNDYRDSNKTRDDTNLRVEPGNSLQSGKAVGEERWDDFDTWPPIERPHEEDTAWEDFDTIESDVDGIKSDSQAETHLQTSKPETEVQHFTPANPATAKSSVPIALHLTDPIQVDGPFLSSAPPTNIPPPTILLSVFPKIFSKALADLFAPINNLESSDRASVLTLQRCRDYLRSYLAVIIVLGRLIAGRKLRWKRDTVLSQSMRIGSVSAGRVTGMKLAGLDRSENAREEKEVADVAKLWKAQVGKVRSTLVTSGLQSAVPEIAEMLPVRIAKSNEGAIISSKQCALCGLKRNERVPKVDVDVQDSFNEWWIEHWGHATCMSFWEAQKRTLTSR